MVRYRDAITGEFVTEEYAMAHPDTTVSETVLSDEEREATLALLRAKREASLQYKNGPIRGGYKDRVAAIDAEIARLTNG